MHATFQSNVGGFIFILHFTAACNDTLNIALNRTAYQSSTYMDHPASLAVDGSRDGSRIPGFPDRDGQFSHTELGSPQWWMVDLGRVFYMYRVRLWNRLGFGR